MWQSYPYLCSMDLESGESLYTPVLNIKIFNGSTPIPLTAIIDSGAESTLVSADIGKVLGINFKKCATTKIGGIVGDSVEGYISYIDVEVDRFEDERLRFKVIFVPGLVTGVLLGQDDFFQHFDVLFEKRKGIFKLSVNNN